MADIFISYSKPDRDLVTKLATFLEAEGWSVWFDKSLVAGDEFRDEIMKQLALARAVITVWTENSVKSEWVRAEAGRAKADGKLIPTKTPSLSYADIPLPFGEMHTENVNSFALVRAAIVAQLTKPAIAPSPFRVAAKNIQLQALTWAGIIGGAITLFTNFSGLISLSDVAKVLVDHWHEYTTALWTFVFEWIGIHIPRELAPILSFLVFASMLVLGINFSLHKGNDPVYYDDVPLRKRVITLCIGIFLWLIIKVGLLLTSRIVPEPTSEIGETILSIAVVSTSVMVTWILPLMFFLYVSKRRRVIFVAWSLFTVLGVCLLYPSYLAAARATLSAKDDAAHMNTLTWIYNATRILSVVQFFCILLTPINLLARRLGLLLIGLIILIGLSELSKLDLRQYLDPKRLSDTSFCPFRKFHPDQRFAAEGRIIA